MKGGESEKKSEGVERRKKRREKEEGEKREGKERRRESGGESEERKERDRAIWLSYESTNLHWKHEQSAQRLLG